MVTELWDKVACYITKYSNIKLWESIRQSYGYYSYLAYLCLVVHELDSDCNVEDVRDLVIKYDIEQESILDFVLKIDGAERFVAEILNVARSYGSVDVNAVYQEYLSRDFIVCNQTVKFEEGKNNRDILGSYYTQENFAYEITRKAIDDYCANNTVKDRIVKVADFSCGGGAFLVSAYRICQEREIPIHVYGYDMDPIAVLIARLRLTMEMGRACNNINVGNSLIHGRSADPFELFCLAAAGKFYDLNMGISVEEKMDIVVGNPPWEKMRFEEKKFLHHYMWDVEIGTKFEREQQLAKVSKENLKYFNSVIAEYELAKKIIKKDSLFVLSNCGELNTYALFTELSLKLLSDNGIAALIVKSSLVKIPVYSRFFKHITLKKILYELYMFVNRRKIFGIDSREEFSVVYLKNKNESGLKVALNLDEYAEFSGHDKIGLSYELLNLLNPDTGMIPNIKNNDELEFLITVYENHRTFGEVYPHCKFGRLVHLTNHAASIKKREDENYDPIYEGKFIEIYTGKYATFRNFSEVDKYRNKASAKLIEDIEGDEYPEARFFIRHNMWEKISRSFDRKYVIAWRSLTSATNKRTMLATILPLIPTCQSIQLLQMSEESEMVQILSLFNSIVFDYIVRLKMAGLDLTQTIIRQIPVPCVEMFYRELEFLGVVAPVMTHINSRICVLYQNDQRVAGFFDRIEKYEIKKQRKELIAELDKLVAFLYGIDGKNLKQIALSFDKYYTKEEVERWF